MQGLIVLSLCNTYSIPSVFLYANSLRARGIFRRFPTVPDLSKLKKVCDLADACGWAWGSAPISRKTCTNLVLVLKMHIFTLCNK